MTPFKTRLAASPEPGDGATADAAGRRHRRPPRSLFGEILDWMLAPLLLLWPLTVALTWVVAQNLAGRPFDRELAATLRAVARHVEVQAAAPADALRPDNPRGRTVVVVRDPATVPQLLRADETERTVFQVLGARGEFIAGDRSLPVPDELPAPAHEPRWRDAELNGDPVRVAYLWLGGTGQEGEQPPLVQVAETLDKRALLATEIIKGVIFPQFVVLPLAVLLVWLALARGIRPLNELQQRIRRRESHDLTPLPERDVPDEVAPLVASINHLLARLDESMKTQKRFLADAAHQLKTPLAGLKMQAELAQREVEGGGATHEPTVLVRSLGHIAHSSERAAHMVNQLLAMARAEGRGAMAPQPIALVALAHETVLDFVPAALNRSIDLGYEGPADDAELHGRLVGQPVMCRELMRNLVDNALRYTPKGGAVTVRVIDDPFGQVLVLQVEDTGPGIPEAERALVLEPFYRALGTETDGSGLGLAIVDQIARQHGAQLSIDDARSRAQAQVQGVGVGALFTVRFPVEAG